MGRFLQSDPIRFAAGDLNVYRYVSNTVPNGTDPLGLDGFINQTAAARAAIKANNPASIAANSETCGMICKTDCDEYYYTTTWGTLSGCDPSAAPCNGEDKEIAYWHTHGNYSDQYGNPTTSQNDFFDSEHFSKPSSQGPGDTGYANQHDLDGYLGTPSNQFWQYDHNGNQIIHRGHL